MQLCLFLEEKKSPEMYLCPCTSVELVSGFKGYMSLCVCGTKAKPSSILSQAVMGFNLALNWTISLTNHYVCVRALSREMKKHCENTEDTRAFANEAQAWQMKMRSVRKCPHFL